MITNTHYQIVLTEIKKMITPGMRSALIFEIIMFLSVLVSIWYSINIKTPKLRQLPAVEGIEEGIARCAEMGRSLHYSLGLGQLYDVEAPLTVAGLAILSYTGKSCAKQGVRIQMFSARGHMVPICQEVLQTAYLEGGEPEMFDLGMVRFVGEDQKALMVAIQGYILREKPGANYMFGALYGETPAIAGSGQLAGCFTVLGTSRNWYQGVMICLSDYCLIGEEIFAAAASLEKRPEQLGSILGQDVCKLIALGGILLSAILVTAGTTLFSKIIGW